MKIPMVFPEAETNAFIAARRALIVALRDTPKDQRNGRTRYTWAEIGEAVGCSAKIVEEAYWIGVEVEQEEDRPPPSDPSQPFVADVMLPRAQEAQPTD